MRLATTVTAVLLLAPLALVTTGCQRKEAPPPPPPAKPASIWTAEDAKTVATAAIQAATQDAWTSQFRDRNGRAARIAIGEITDHSGKEVDIAGFEAALTAALGDGGDKLAVAQSAETADCILKGTIGASSATEDGQAVTYFSIDLRFVDAKSGDPIWPFGKEHRVAR